MGQSVAADAEAALAVRELVGSLEQLRAVGAAAEETIGHSCEGGVYAVDLHGCVGDVTKEMLVRGRGMGEEGRGHLLLQLIQRLHGRFKRVQQLARLGQALLVHGSHEGASVVAGVITDVRSKRR